MDLRPVGVFDSGLGGLTAVKKLRELLPEENIIYFADSARVPYGEKTPEELRRIARQDMDFLSSQNVKVILAACGTVSCNSAETIENYPLRAFGVKEDAVHAMVSAEGSGALGIIATEASIKSGGYYSAIKKLSPEKELIAVSCPDFVPLIEGGCTGRDDEKLRAAVEKYLRPIRDAKASAVLLGCTHYGIIANALQEYLGPEVKLVSAAETAAESIGRWIEENKLQGRGGELKCFTSGSAVEFSLRAETFLGEKLSIPPVHVPVMEV